MCQDFEEDLPPHDLDAERCVLGAMLLRRDCRDARLKGEHFYSTFSQWTFHTIRALERQGRDVDAVSVVEELNKVEGIVEYGEIGAILRMLETSSHVEHFSHNVEVVLEMWLRRRLLACARWLTLNAYDLRENPRETWETLQHIEL